jgi:hypothetical protein
VQNFTDSGPVVLVASGQKAVRLVQRYTRVTQSAETTTGTASVNLPTSMQQFERRLPRTVADGSGHLWIGVVVDVTVVLSAASLTVVRMSSIRL